MLSYHLLRLFKSTFWHLASRLQLKSVWKRLCQSVWKTCQRYGIARWWWRAHCQWRHSSTKASSSRKTDVACIVLVCLFSYLLDLQKNNNWQYFCGYWEAISWLLKARGGGQGRCRVLSQRVLYPEREGQGLWWNACWYADENEQDVIEWAEPLRYQYSSWVPESSGSFQEAWWWNYYSANNLVAYFWPLAQVGG